MIKKKISKKIAAVAIGVVLSAMSCMSVFADYTYEIGWSDEPCPVCKEDVAVWIKEVHKDSYASGAQEICSHHRFGVDVEMIKRVITEYDCRVCKYSWSREENISYLECHGFDNVNN